MSQGPLTEQIAANREDTRALLEDNRHLAMALLSRLLKDFENETRERFRKQAQRLDSLEAGMKTLKDRIELAAVRFRELRDEVEQLRNGKGE